MKALKKVILLFLTISLMLGSSYSIGWAQENASKDEWKMMDLFLARPLGVAAGVVGVGLFILSLPFTIPTKSVDNAVEMFINKPFNFSFAREFPDENI